MTTYESIMLSVCFGAVVGSFIGNLICLIKYSIEERKLKKQLKELDSDKGSKQEKE